MARYEPHIDNKDAGGWCHFPIMHVLNAIREKQEVNGKKKLTSILIISFPNIRSVTKDNFAFIASNETAVSLP